jgi:hypothetical protein
MALERLRFDHLEGDAKLTDPTSDYFNQPAKFALHKYLFFQCFQCRRPYFGGAYECGGNALPEEKKDLICPRCQPPSEDVQECKTHGTDWVTFARKYDTRRYSNICLD